MDDGLEDREHEFSMQRYGSLRRKPYLCFLTQNLSLKMLWDSVASGKMLALWVSQVGIKISTAQKRKPWNHEAEWSLMWPRFCRRSRGESCADGAECIWGLGSCRLSALPVSWWWAHDWQHLSPASGELRKPPASEFLRLLLPGKAINCAQFINHSVQLGCKLC